MKTKSRKRYPSDDRAALRVARDLHKKIKAAAKADRRTVAGFVDMTMTAALAAKKI